MTNGWWRPPDAPLRLGVALAAGCGLAGTALIATIVGRWLDAGPAYPFAATATFAAAMGVAAGAAGAGHPFARFGPANVVTTVRLVLVALMAGLTMMSGTTGGAWLAVTATAVAAVLDGVDGWLARRSGLASEFGARFDMETDALLILVLSGLVWTSGKAGAWVLACGLMRYLFVAAGWMLPWMARPLVPTIRGKTVAVLQFVGLAAALSPPVPPDASAVVAAATLATLAWSFAVDVGRLRRGDDADGVG